MSALNIEEILKFIQDPEIKQGVWVTSLVQIKGKDRPFFFRLSNGAATKLVLNLTRIWQQTGSKPSEILFKVHFSGNTMYFEFNTPPFKY